MPGQPRKMAEKVTDLEAQAFCFAAEIFLTAPRKYIVEPDRPDDPVWQGWKACIKLSMLLHIAVLEQANRLREKAGLEPIPDIFSEDTPNDGGESGVGAAGADTEEEASGSPSGKSCAEPPRGRAIAILSRAPAREAPWRRPLLSES